MPEGRYFQQQSGDVWVWLWDLIMSSSQDRTELGRYQACALFRGRRKLGELTVTLGPGKNQPSCRGSRWGGSDQGSAFLNLGFFVCQTMSLSLPRPALHKAHSCWETVNGK